MKKIVVITLLLISSFQLKAQSQMFVKAGTAYSNIVDSGDLFSQTGYRSGIQFGLLYTYKIEGNWNLLAEFLYSDKGYKINDNQNPDSRLKFNYLNIPIFLGYNIKKFSIELGPEIGYQISAFQRNNGEDNKIDDFFNKFELAVTSGVSYMVIDQVLINLRYSRGVISVAEYITTDSAIGSRKEYIYNHSFQLSVALKVL